MTISIELKQAEHSKKTIQRPPEMWFCDRNNHGSHTRHVDGRTAASDLSVDS